ncbi:MAG: hypothetical protein M3R40_00200 [Pseudomonadota bacterium]|nr:hypothetical protein [Pseudomonadota bacterium]
MQTPICQVINESSADPAGGDIKHTAHLYVPVPMFGRGSNFFLYFSSHLSAMNHAMHH